MVSCSQFQMAKGSEVGVANMLLGSREVVVCGADWSGIKNISD